MGRPKSPESGDRGPAAGRYDVAPMQTAQVMGVLNVTPDSFSDGGCWRHVDDAVARAMEMLEHGAAVIDVGGESTRPGAEPVGIDEELARVIPVIERISPVVGAARGRVSIDTRHAEVAVAAVAAGAAIVNDVSASLELVAADLGVGWIAMHMAGEPRTMQDHPHYDDVVAEVTADLVEAAERGRRAGVREIWIDPGIGFGKSFAHNWELLGSLSTLVGTGIPVVVGASRKGFLGEVLSRSDGSDAAVPVDDRLEGSMTVATWAALMGVAMIRVHDVRPTVQAVTVVGDPQPGSVVPLMGSVR